MKALILNSVCKQCCLSPGLLVHQLPLSPPPQALSVVLTAASRPVGGDTFLSTALYSLFTALSVPILFAPYQIIKHA